MRSILRPNVLACAGIVLALAAHHSLATPAGAGAQERRFAVTGATIDEAALSRAFEAVKAGDFGPLAALPVPTAAAIAAIERGLSDGSEAVRRESVTLLSLLRDPRAAPALAKALDDPSADVAWRAAAALYVLGPDAIAGDPSVGERLRSAVAGGLTAGGAILMLAHAPANGASAAALEAARAERGDVLTEVFNASPVVPVALMADVALARLGDRQAQDRLVDAIGTGDLDTLQFLLSALREIATPRVIETLATATLADDRPVDGDMVSSAEPGVRLADLAAVRLAHRFDLPVAVGELAVERLPDETLRNVRQALAEQLKGSQ
jgi:HEAT repeat protein